MSAHTPGPWRAIRWSCHASTTIVADTDPAEPAVLGDQEVLQYGHTTVADCHGSLRDGGNEANAARIVACVNACAGMDDPQGTISGLFVARETLETVAAHRDELAALLRQIVNAEGLRMLADALVQAPQLLAKLDAAP